MVNSDGQLYTIEGISAALIILMTAFIVVNSTSVYTMGDTHLSDMQLEVIGSDAMNMMNTAPNSSYQKSPLQIIIEDGDSAAFRTLFLDILSRKAGGDTENIQYMANVTYITTSGTINSSILSTSSHPFVGGEHAVRVSQWVIVDRQFPQSSPGKHAALVEVLLWRD